MRWSSTPISKNFPVCCDPHKGFSGVNEAEVDIFLEFPCFLHNPANVSSLISGSSASLKPNLYTWKFWVHLLLKPSLKNFEHNLVCFTASPFRNLNSSTGIFFLEFLIFFCLVFFSFFFGLSLLLSYCSACCQSYTF